MIIDLHVHQKLHSADSKLDLRQAVYVAKEKGLDGICVTDHDDLGFKALAKDLAAELAFPIFVGVEIYTLDGDLLCFGIDEMPQTRMSAQETIDYVNERGGTTIAAHPFRNNKRGLESKLFEVEGLGAVEAFNGRTDDFSNMRAKLTAKELGLPMTGGSDSHTEVEVGNYATRFKIQVHTMDDLVYAIKNGLVEPVSFEEVAVDVETSYEENRNRIYA